LTLTTGDLDLETHRVELTGYCYRMLGGPFEAEDAVQEAFVRAWRGGFDLARGPLKTWLYTMSTNVCVDMLRSAQRRAVAMDLTSPAALGGPLPASAWVRPVPDERVLPADVLAEGRETVRLVERPELCTSVVAEFLTTTPKPLMPTRRVTREAAART
jgi:RNA polymerase sigma-70 factor (ECF subfamily)